MKSRQQRAKEIQGYNPHPVVRKCSNCEHYSSRHINLLPHKEVEIRCTLGDFACKKTSCCDVHKFKEVHNVI